MTLAARNQSMYAAWKSGLTIAEVARRHGLRPTYTRKVVRRLEAREQEAAAPPKPQPQRPMPSKPPEPNPTLAAERERYRRKMAERQERDYRLMRARQLVDGNWSAGADELAEAARLLWPHFGADQLAEVVSDALEMQRTERRRVEAEARWTPPEREPRFGWSDAHARAWDGIFADSLERRPVVRKAREE